MNHPARVRRNRKMSTTGVRGASEPSTTRLVKRAAPSEGDSHREILLASLLQTGVQLQTFLDRTFSQHGLTMLDASIVLRCVESQITLTPGKLAAALGRDKGTITRAVDRLEKESFLTRVTGKFDRRISLLKPTKRAKNIAPSLKALFSTIRHQMFAEISDRDSAHLILTLAQLRKNAATLGRNSADLGKPSARSPLDIQFQRSPS
jgi:DNA-binding MarR family transcriptional regulator